jgi:hypothetical protein
MHLRSSLAGTRRSLGAYPTPKCGATFARSLRDNLKLTPMRRTSGLPKFCLRNIGPSRLRGPVIGVFQNRLQGLSQIRLT